MERLLPKLSILVFLVVFFPITGKALTPSETTLPPTPQKLDFESRFLPTRPSCQAGFERVGNTCFKKCKPGFHAEGERFDKCVKDVPLMVDRGFFGWCPSGYVDHPRDPKLCVLPIVQKRMMR